MDLRAPGKIVATLRASGPYSMGMASESVRSAPRPEVDPPGGREPGVGDHAWLSRLALRLARTPADADDLAQRASLELIEKPPKDVKDYGPWVYGMMRNLERTRTLSDFRRNRRERTAAPPTAVLPPDEVVGAEETGKILATATDSLPEPYRETIRLRYYEGASSAEIARRSGLPSATVRSHLKRGLDILRRNLESKIGPEWRASCVMFASLGHLQGAGQSTGGGTVGGAGLGKGAVASLCGVLGISAWLLLAGPGEPDVATSSGVASLAASVENVEPTPPMVSTSRSGTGRLWRASLQAVDAETKEPIWPVSVGGAGVSAEPPQEGSEAGGEFLILNLEGDTTLSIAAEGYLDAGVSIRAEDAGPLVVALQRDAVIRLQIADPEVHPAAAGSFLVAAWRSDRPTPDLSRDLDGSQVRIGAADESGEIVLHGLEQGVNYDLVGAGGGFVLPGTIRGALPDSQPIPVSLRQVYGVRLVPQEGRAGPPARISSLRRIEPSSIWTPGSLDETFIVPGSPVRQLLLSTLDGHYDDELGFDLTYLCGQPLGTSKAPASYCLRLPGYAAQTGVAAFQPVLSSIHEEPVVVERQASGFGTVRVEVTIPRVWEEAGLEPSIDGALVFRGRSAGGERFGIVADLDSSSVGGKVLESFPAGEYEVSLHGPTGLGGRPGGILPIATATCSVVSGSEATLRFDLADYGAARLTVGEAGQGFRGSIRFVLMGGESSDIEESVTWTGGPYDIWAMPDGHYRLRLPATLLGSAPTISVDGPSFSIVAGELAEIDLADFFP